MSSYCLPGQKGSVYDLKYIEELVTETMCYSNYQEPEDRNCQGWGSLILAIRAGVVGGCLDMCSVGGYMGYL